MNRDRFKRVLVTIVCGGLISLGLPARAEMVPTTQLLAAVSHDDARKVADFMARDDVRERLEAFGVNPAQAAERVAALTDAELQFLAQHIESQPAGGLLGVIGVVFVVLIVLELVGVIDLFKKI